MRFAILSTSSWRQRRRLVAHAHETVTPGLLRTTYQLSSSMIMLTRMPAGTRVPPRAVHRCESRSGLGGHDDFGEFGRSSPTRRGVRCSSLTFVFHARVAVHDKPVGDRTFGSAGASAFRRPLLSPDHRIRRRLGVICYFAHTSLLRLHLPGSMPSGRARRLHLGCGSRVQSPFSRLLNYLAVPRMRRPITNAKSESTPTENDRR